MNTVKQRVVLLAFLLACLTANAQKALNIGTIFDDYGKKEGSILIELGKDVLGNHTRINYYKSLIVNVTPERIDATEKAVWKDAENGIKLMESIRDGRIEKAYYSLKKQAESPVYEYIMFSCKSKKITLIYLKGNFTPDCLEDELGKLKDLFIKVNNKRIKL